MMPPSRRCIYFVAVTLVVLWVVPAPAAVQLRSSYRVDSPITLHEPVILEREFDNSTSEAIDLHLGRNSLGGLILSLIRPNGATVTAHPGEGPAIGGPYTMNTIRMKPGEHYVQRILLNEWLDFGDVGSYRLDVRFKGAGRTASGDNVTISRDASVAIMVLPRDGEKLREVCNGWLNQLLQPRDADDAREAAKALASINDPIAVGYLRDVIRSDMSVFNYAITALRRMATPEAIQVLQEATADKRPMVVKLAEAALAEIGKSTKKLSTV